MSKSEIKQVRYHLTPRSRPALLSLVIPIFNEEEVLPLLVARITDLLSQTGCATEVLLVDDGSSDRTIFALRALAESDSQFKVIALARNFGHQIAATAGLDFARGDAVVLMDADLQDPPELVLEMIQKYEEGYDVVYARRISRENESIFKRASAWLFYRGMRLMSGQDLPVDTGDFRLMSRRCVDALNSMRETHRFLRGMVTWVGFSQTAVDFVRPGRAAGTTKYPLTKMIRFAWTAALMFSAAPLRVSFVAGTLLFGIGVWYALFALFTLLTGGYLVPGWTSLIMISCLGSGVNLLAIGVVGEYVAKIFEQIKERPLYLIGERVNVAEAPGRPAGTAFHPEATRIARNEPTEVSPLVQAGFRGEN
jgi:polyisoprenyl-phosphate glycosyltransferase